MLVVDPLGPVVQRRGPADDVVRLPLVARSDVRVQERVGVALDLEVDPPELRVPPRADRGHRATEGRHVLEEDQLLLGRQVGDLVGSRIVGDQHAVPRKVLDVADHGEAGSHPAQDSRVGAGQRGADPVGAEVVGHAGEANVGAMLETQRERVPGNDGGELDTALAFLNFQRACVFKKIDGLDEEQLRRRLVASDTTLLGLVKHCADGERWWFAHHVGGDPAYADIDWSLVVPEDVSSEEVIADYRAAIAESDGYIEAAGSPETRTEISVGEDGP